MPRGADPPEVTEDIVEVEVEERMYRVTFTKINGREPEVNVKHAIKNGWRTLPRSDGLAWRWYEVVTAALHKLARDHP